MLGQASAATNAIVAHNVAQNVIGAVVEDFDNVLGLQQEKTVAIANTVNSIGEAMERAAVNIPNRGLGLTVNYSSASFSSQ